MYYFLLMYICYKYLVSAIVTTVPCNRGYNYTINNDNRINFHKLSSKQTKLKNFPNLLNLTFAINS